MFGISAATALTVAAAGVTAYTSYKSSKNQTQAITDNNNAQIEANKVDPRITSMLFGNGAKTLKPGATAQWTDTPNQYGYPSQAMSNPASDYTSDSGLLGRYQSLMDKPQALGTQQYGQANDNYIGAFTAHDLEAARGGATGLLAGDTAAPQMQAAHATAASAGPAQVNAPAHNGMNLAGSYNDLISGPAGANPYLTGAIAKGINQSSNAFGNMVTDAKAATQDVLGSVRSNAVVSGQYGGSRQGLAEGRAIESMNTQLGRAVSQFGQNNTDAAVAAQAGAYDADKNRQLSATQGLGAQQYGVASQNAGLTQQATPANADRTQQTSQYNAGLAQNASQSNQQAQMSTNSLNSSNTQAGMAGLGGLLSQASGAAGNQDQYAMHQAQNTNSLLSPYLSKDGTPTQLTPAYDNSGASALGGAMAGVGLAQKFTGLLDRPPAIGSGAVNGMASGMGQSMFGSNWWNG